MVPINSQGVVVGAAVLFFCTFLPVAESIYCYQCNSRNDTGCLELKKEDVWSSYYKPCPDEGLLQYTFCRKMEQTIKLPGEEHTRTIRKCGYAKHTRDCYAVRDDDHEEYVCQCFEDGCNSSTSLISTVSVLAVSIFTSWMFF